MQYINQQLFSEDTRCGAFCITYWEWINGKKQIPESTEYNRNLGEQQNENVKRFLDDLSKIYDTVKFKPEDINILIEKMMNLPGLNDVDKNNVKKVIMVVMEMFEKFSNPIKMLSYLNILCKDFNVTLQTFNDKFGTLLIELAKVNDNVDATQIIYKDAIDDLEEGEYAILIFGADMNLLKVVPPFSMVVQDGLEKIVESIGGLMPMHYILVKGTGAGLEILDPTDGNLGAYGKNISGFTSAFPLKNMYTTIYIRKK